MELAISEQRSLSILAALAYTDGTLRDMTFVITPTNIRRNTTTDLYSINNELSGPLSEVDYSLESLYNGSILLRDFAHVRNFQLNYDSLSEVKIAASYRQPLFLFPLMIDRDDRYLNIGIDRNSSDVETWLAGLMARMPAALIAFLDSSGLLNQTMIQQQQTNTRIKSQLVVEWWRIWAVFGTLSFLQVAAALAALRYCRAVIVKDNSMIVVAQTLITATQESGYEVTSIADGKEIAGCLGDSELRYGTVWSEGVPRVDIRRNEQVESRFPAGEYD